VLGRPLGLQLRMGRSSGLREKVSSIVGSQVRIGDRTCPASVSTWQCRFLRHMKCGYQRTCGYEGTWCVTITTNWAGDPMDINEMLLRSSFDPGLWIRQNNIERRQIVYGQSLTGALELGKEWLGISGWNVTNRRSRIAILP